MMNRILNAMRGEGQRAAATKAPSRRGTISSYDPNSYSAKVIIQPEGFETGFLPIGSPWVGSNFGMFCGPSIGDEVDVHFQEGGKNAGYISLRFFGNNTPPLAVPSGEFWVVHASGSIIKLTNDGIVTLQDAGGSALTLNGDGSSTLVSDLTINGTLTVAADIWDRGGTAGTIQDIRNTYDAHDHPAPGGTTGVPNQQM